MSGAGGGSKKNIMVLGDVMLDIDTVSAILKDDSHINHQAKGSTSMHFFLIIADGQKVEVFGKDREHRDLLKAQLIQRLGWNNE